jgi:hypothetical protein
MKSPSTLSARTRAAHLVALSAFGIAQPMFQVLGDNPAYLAVQGLRGLDVVILSIGVVLAVPALTMGIELVAGLVHGKAVLVIHELFVVILTFVVLVQALHYVPFAFAALPVAALVLAMVAARTYRTWVPARAFLSICALAPILFVTLFLFKAPLGALSAIDSPAGTVRPVSARTSVVLVIFDEFASSALMNAQGEIDSVRYPKFAELARSSTWYRNATTVYDTTYWAVPAILTGRIPSRKQLPVLADYPQNLFTLLGRSYDVHAFQAFTRLCPVSVCPNATLPLDTRLRRVLAAVRETSRLRVPDQHGHFESPTEELSDFMATAKPSRRPELRVLHLLLPHKPLEYLPSGRKYEGSGSIEGYTWDRWTADRRLVEQAYQRYLLQVGYTDRVLGQVVRRLRDTGLWDRSLVIVTADHGVSHWPGSRRRLVETGNIADIAPVPLFVKRPGQVEGDVDEQTARSIDILPTIADVLGTDVPWRVDGESLLSSLRPRPSQIVVRSYTGGVVKAAWRRVEAERDAAIARKIRMFGSGSESLFARGAYRELVGHRPASYPVWRNSKLHADVRRPSTTRFDPQSSFAPVRVTGTVTGGPARELKLAVAVNGRIAAVTETFRNDGTTRFETFVPESALQPGANVITIFAVRGDPPGRVRLAQVGSASS